MTTLPVVVNPAARGGRAAPPREALERAADARGLTLEWWATEGPGHATELARRAARDRYPMLAAWGGDGTYNETAQGLLDSETALVVLPGGTTSVLAYELGIARDAATALTSQLDAPRRAMSVGRTDRGQLFLLMFSAGPDALILSNLPDTLKRRAGKAGITAQAFVEFARAHLPRFTVAANGGVREAAWCIVGNSRCYGGPFAATPGADPFRRGLEVVALTRFGRRAVVPFFFAIPRGRHLALPGVERFPADEVAFTAEEDVPYQLDGDPVGRLPVSLRASEERLWVLAPETR